MNRRRKLENADLYKKSLLHVLLILTVSSHPHLQTLPESAVLTPVPLTLVHPTLTRASTLVACLLPDGSLEEPLASLTTDSAIMSS